MTSTSLFKNKRFPLIGVVHLPALPGDPRASQTQSYQDVYEFALRDARRLIEGGISGIIVENFGSSPFHKGSQGHRIPPHQLAAMTVVCQEIRRLDPRCILGVNCLRNDAYSALGIAAATQAHFIRVNVHTSAYMTDQGIIEGEAPLTLNYRNQVNRNLEIFADILVKHATPLAPLSLEQTAQDTYKRGGANALIVSGHSTGSTVDEERLQRLRSSLPDVPLWIGSGLNETSLEMCMRYATGAIVGTALKEGGDVHAPVDVNRVKALVEQVNHFLHS